MSEEIKHNRRRFLGTAAMTLTATQLGLLRSAGAQPSKTKPADLPTVEPGTNTSFASLKQIDAGVLNGADAPRRHIQAYARHSP